MDSLRRVCYQYQSRTSLETAIHQLEKHTIKDDAVEYIQSWVHRWWISRRRKETLIKRVNKVCGLCSQWYILQWNGTYFWNTRLPRIVYTVHTILLCIVSLPRETMHEIGFLFSAKSRRLRGKALLKISENLLVTHFLPTGPILSTPDLDTHSEKQGTSISDRLPAEIRSENLTNVSQLLDYLCTSRWYSVLK